MGQGRSDTARVLLCAGDHARHDPRVLRTYGRVERNFCQFPDPPPGLDNAQPSCSVCAPPTINNGQTYLFTDTLLPQQTGPWIPLTQNAWMFYGGSFSTTLDPAPMVGYQTGVIQLDQYGEIHFGCNVRTPKSQVTSVTALLRISTGTATLSIWSGSGAHTDLVPDVDTSWNRYTWQIAGNPDVPDPFNDLQIQTNTAGTFYVDDFRFVFEPNNDTCAGVWYYPQVLPPAKTNGSIQNKIDFKIFIFLMIVFLFV